MWLGTSTKIIPYVIVSKEYNGILTVPLVDGKYYIGVKIDNSIVYKRRNNPMRLRNVQTDNTSTC